MTSEKIRITRLSDGKILSDEEISQTFYGGGSFDDCPIYYIPTWGEWRIKHSEVDYENADPLIDPNLYLVELVSPKLSALEQRVREADEVERILKTLTIDSRDHRITISFYGDCINGLGKEENNLWKVQHHGIELGASYEPSLHTALKQLTEQQ